MLIPKERKEVSVIGNSCESSLNPFVSMGYLLPSSYNGQDTIVTEGESILVVFKVRHKQTEWTVLLLILQQKCSLRTCYFFTT